MLDFLEKNKNISHLSNFQTQATAEYFFEIHSLEQLGDLKKIFTFIQEESLNYLIIGGGTNLLFAFDNFEGIVIQNSLYGWSYNEKTSILESFSAEPISDIARVLETDDHQDLWHRFIGLPGSIGGAVFGNAGCFGLETENNFLEAYLLDITTGETLFLSQENMNFHYRTSILKQSKKYFLLKAKFDLSKKIEKYHSDVDNLYFREYKQPKGNTCGSFFKNPSKEQSAGMLIEQVGLKGYKIGGAFFSELHANFLMSDGTATYNNLLELIELARLKVNDIHGVLLEPEVRIISKTGKIGI
ncbi:MAG: UDP-N-acetylmuramate dehydrogenase [Candidatus Gracilibacteria bacterium]|nr:UDP-N-acetylmuramate dehydrogenase [Candidatus Gracilibacteria bacterium]